MAYLTLKYPTEQEKTDARKAGLKGREPGWSKTRQDGSRYSPKKTEKNWNAYVTRHNKWTERVKRYAKKYRDKHKLTGGKTEAQHVDDLLNKRK